MKWNVFTFIRWRHFLSEWLHFAVKKGKLLHHIWNLTVADRPGVVADACNSASRRPMDANGAFAPMREGILVFLHLSDIFSGFHRVSSIHLPYSHRTILEQEYGRRWFAKSSTCWISAIYRTEFCNRSLLADWYVFLRFLLLHRLLFNNIRVPFFAMLRFDMFHRVWRVCWQLQLLSAWHSIRFWNYAVIAKRIQIQEMKTMKTSLPVVVDNKTTFPKGTFANYRSLVHKTIRYFSDCGCIVFHRIVRFLLDNRWHRLTFGNIFLSTSNSVIKTSTSRAYEVRVDWHNRLMTCRWLNYRSNHRSLSKSQTVVFSSSDDLWSTCESPNDIKSEADVDDEGNSCIDDRSSLSVGPALPVRSTTEVIHECFIESSNSERTRARCSTVCVLIL